MELSKKMKCVSIPAEMHAGLSAKNYSVALLTRRLLSEYMAANNIPWIPLQNQDQDQQAA